MIIKNDKRKIYQKPAMRVFDLQSRPTILAGSGEKDGYPGVPW